MNTAHRFLLDHLGRLTAPGQDDPGKTLSTPHPMFGFKNVAGKEQKPSFRGAIGNEKQVYLVVASKVTVDLYLGNFYMSPEAAQQKRDEKKQPYVIHEHWPALLHARGVGPDFPIRIRVWQSGERVGNPFPTEVLSAYRGFPLTFMQGRLNTMRFRGINGVPIPMLDEIVRLATVGEPYLCFKPTKSPDNILPHLDLFKGAVGVSTDRGTQRMTLRRLNTIARIAGFGTRPTFLYRAIRRLDRGMNPSGIDIPGEWDKAGATWKWISKRLKDRRRWDAGDMRECEDRDGALAKAVMEIGEVAVQEGLDDLDLEQAQSRASYNELEVTS